MKIKVTKFERVAGLFVLFAALGTVFVTIGIAVQKGWFSSKVQFNTVLQNADGIHNGTKVQISGLRAGEVDQVELISADEVLVRMTIFQKFHKRIRTDSKVQVVRPFVIGEKVLEISVGSESEQILQADSKIPSQESLDVMDIVSGRKLGPFLKTAEGMMLNLKTLAEAFSDPKRSEALVKMFDRLNPLLGNLLEITQSAIKNKRTDVILGNLSDITKDLNTILPDVKSNSPELGKQVGELLTNLNILTKEFKKLTPAIATVAPDLPQASLRALEALNEAVVLLKAMQRNFFLSGKVKEVREEEAKQELDRKRYPASGLSNQNEE